MSAVRAFVAIELAPDFTSALLEAGEILRSGAPEWAGEKWVAADNLHLTLQFLGNVEETALARLAGSLEPSVAAHAQFALRLAGVRAVPSPRRASMVWAQLADEPAGACAALAASVATRAAEAGVACDERAFAPHVTLVRARRPRRLATEALTCADAFARGGEISMSVLSATLFASTLTRRGPIYEPLARWDLSGRAGRA